MSPPDPQDEVFLTPEYIRLPTTFHSPWFELSRRLVIAAGILIVTFVWAVLDRRNFIDGASGEHGISVIDSLYYSTITLSTTGYGDITPYAQHTRFIDATIMTPLRIIFLVLLIGAGVEVLATRGRELFRTARWRKHLDNHVVVIGYGTKGRSAVSTLVKNGFDKQKILVVDIEQTAVAEASTNGFAAVIGDASRRQVLRRAGVESASQVIITTPRDDTTVLATLTVRQLNPETYIAAAVREHDNAPLVRQSGADAVITSSDAVGRLIGLSSISPPLASVLEDLLTKGEGLEVAERELLPSEVGKTPHSLPDQVLAVLRDEQVYRYFDPTVNQLARGDRLVVVRSTQKLPWAPRPGVDAEATAAEENQTS